jgi:outer membrane protein assembly factor BamB
LGTVVPLAGQTKPTPSQKTPPALPVYEYAWKADLGASGPIELAVGTSMAFAAGGDNALAAFAIADGRRVWTATDVGPAARLLAAGGLLFVVTPSHLDALGRTVASRLDALGQSDGHPVWKIESLPDPVIGPVVRGNMLFLATGAEIRAYFAYDGFVSWRATLDAAAVALAGDGERLFVALDDRALLSIDTNTRAVSWRTVIERRVTYLVAANRRVFVCGDDGALYAYRQDRRGPAIWRVARTDAVGPPAVDDRHVYVAQFDNTARAYDAGNGTERWRLRLGSRPEAGVRVAGAHVFIPLLSGAMATSIARAGQPSSEIPLSTPAGDPAPANTRLGASGLSSDAGLIFRVTRPAEYTAWTLTAVKRKEGQRAEGKGQKEDGRK